MKMYQILLGILFLVCFYSANSQNKRIETDLLGKKEVPIDAYYGIQTQRAIENFSISNSAINSYPDFIKAWGIVKLAAAQANHSSGKMDDKTFKSVSSACQELISGNYQDQFIIDMYQGGAGTSTNMNANEVLANIALEKAGEKKGSYKIIAPNDHLNMSQSTNDAYPTALKITMLLQNIRLKEELKALAQSFRKLGNEHLNTIKMGRTEMQDAVPMTVGQEFHAFAQGLEAEISNLEYAESKLMTTNMGATAIGTGLNTPDGYADAVSENLSRLLNMDIKKADDLINGTWDLQSFVIYSAALKTLAVKTAKIANDLILLSSGPRNGLFEINLPKVQPGSSIMPGKVNPVIPELVALVSYRVIGNDVTVTMAAADGDLQLNAYEPVIAVSIFESQHILTNTLKTFREKCVSGITINEDTHKRNLETTVGIVTALNPVLGYKKATEIAKESLETGKGVLEIIREQNLLTEEQIEEIFSAENLTHLSRSKYPEQ